MRWSESSSLLRRGGDKGNVWSITTQVDWRRVWEWRVLEFLAGLVGAVIGGFFALAGAFTQSRMAHAQQEDRFKHERRIAAEEHARRQAASENAKLRGMIEAQLEYGRRVMVAAARFEGRIAKTTSLTEALFDAVKFAGLPSWDQPSPYHSWVIPDELEDGDLRADLSRHKNIIQRIDIDLAFADTQPNRLSRDIAGALADVDELSMRVRIRMRELQRQGRPF